jgi:hypothetical protein
MKVNEFLLREARPETAYRCQIRRNAGGQLEARILPCQANWDFLSHVEAEGYDANAINGPTYWRSAPPLYCSVFRNPKDGELVLLIAETAPEDESDDHPQS